MLLLSFRSVGRVICGSLDSYRCFVALLMRDVCLRFVASAYSCTAGTMLVMAVYSYGICKCTSRIGTGGIVPGPNASVGRANPNP